MELTALNDPSRRFIEDDSITVVAKVQVHLHSSEPQPEKKKCGYDEKLFLEQPVPEACMCGICMCVMEDPVLCPEGHKCVLSV